MLEAGRYKARGVEAMLGYTSTGKEQIGVLLETAEGNRITWYGYFTDQTTERTFESLRALGWEGDDLSDLRGIDRNEVEIVVEHEPDNHGEIRARVRWINRSGGLAMKESMPQDAARAFAARMKGAAIASRQRSSASAPTAPRNGRSAPPQRRAPAPAGEFGDDDIPF